MAEVKRKTPAKASAKASARKPGVHLAAVSLASGAKVALDGDLVYLIDALDRDLAVASGFATGYTEVHKEIARILGQMDDAALREYFSASLFLNYVTYENEMAERRTAAIAAKARRARAR